jgi:hypothetical protein
MLPLRAPGEVSSTLSFWAFLFLSYEVCTQSLTVARQALYHLNYILNPFLCQLFFR